MAQLRRMAAAYRRLLSDFYLPRPPEDDPLPHDFRRLPGEVAFRYSKALRYQLRQARQRRVRADPRTGFFGGARGGSGKGAWCEPLKLPEVKAVSRALGAANAELLDVNARGACWLRIYVNQVS